MAPLESLFTEERRCPRCGAFLNDERRDTERRGYVRRQNPADEPGPPDSDERRVAERRRARRRKPAGLLTARFPTAGRRPRPADSGRDRVLGPRWLDEPVAEGEGDRLELRVDPELAHDVLDVGPKRVRGDEQLLADLGRREALGQRPEDLELARRQRLDDPALVTALARGI